MAENQPKRNSQPSAVFALPLHIHRVLSCAESPADTDWRRNADYKRVRIIRLQPCHFGILSIGAVQRGQISCFQRILQYQNQGSADVFQVGTPQRRRLSGFLRASRLLSYHRFALHVRNPVEIWRLIYH